MNCTAILAAILYRKLINDKDSQKLPCQHLGAVHMKIVFPLFPRLNRHCVKSVQVRSFVWSVFSRIRTAYGEILGISPYSVQMWENTDQKKLRSWIHFTQCRKKVLFPCVHIRNISPPGRYLFWRAGRWENFERSQYSKWITSTWRKMAQFCCIWTYQGWILILCLMGVPQLLETRRQHKTFMSSSLTSRQKIIV